MPFDGPSEGSLFALPSSGDGRRGRLAVVLALDVVLAAAGVAMVVSYVHARHAAARPSARAEATGGAAAAPGTPAAGPPPKVDVKTEKPRVVGTRKAGTTASPPPTGTKPGTPGTSTGGSGVTPPAVTPPAVTPPAVTPPAGTPDAGVAVVTPPGSAIVLDAAPAVVTPPPGPTIVPDAAPIAPVEGELTTDEQSLADGVQATVEGHMGQVRRCWENVAKNSAESNAPQGTVEVEFAVGQGGAAQDVRVSKNETGSDQLATCVVALVQSWQFPRHTGDPVVFVWPFLFRTAK